MRMPGFSAENSHYRTSWYYFREGGDIPGLRAGAVTPQRCEEACVEYCDETCNDRCRETPPPGGGTPPPTPSCRKICCVDGQPQLA